MLLGLLVALGLGLVDALWSLSLRQLGQIILQVGMAVALGGLGGLLGGLIGQGLVSVSGTFKVIGWTITGVLIGASLGEFDVLTGLVRGQELRAAWRKVFKGGLGGTIGGVLGGILYVMLGQTWRSTSRESVRAALEPAGDGLRGPGPVYRASDRPGSSDPQGSLDQGGEGFPGRAAAHHFEG